MIAKTRVGDLMPPENPILENLVLLKTLSKLKFCLKKYTKLKNFLSKLKFWLSKLKFWLIKIHDLENKAYFLYIQ